MPKLSVLMSVYNGEEFVGESIRSVVEQDFTDFEFIIIDDCSTDRSVGILQKAADCDSRVKLVRNRENIGLTKSLNKGMALVTGQYVARQDADDESLPGRFSRQVAYLDKHPDVGVVSGAHEIVDAGGEVVHIQRAPEAHYMLTWILCTGHNAMSHPTTMFRTHVVKELGGYDESFYAGQDYELWCRVMEKAQLAFMANVEVRRQYHSGQMSIKHSDVQWANSQRVLKRNGERILGKELTSDECSALRRVNNYSGECSGRDLELAIPLMVEFYEAIAIKLALSSDERRAILDEFGKKISGHPMRMQSKSELCGRELLVELWRRLTSRLKN